jgi:hypothetical protein
MSKEVRALRQHGLHRYTPALDRVDFPVVLSALE